MNYSEVIKHQWDSGKRNKQRSSVYEKICIYCKNNFVTKISSRKCCSVFCASRIGRPKLGKIMNCTSCNKEIYRKKKHLIWKFSYCSRQCAGTERSKQLQKLFAIRRKGNRFYVSGRRYEYKTVQKLLLQGYQIVTRSPGSRGIFDVYAIGFTQDKIILRFIQVKGLRNKKTVISALSKKERAALLKGITKNTFIWGMCM